ncbi:hypothetical protein RDWZM_003884 [Blomia tropicalis]|uniref:Uncharacterized protein n=1 Tax=Blomia tropicalis TaxID=40697 RepID=A0A9Q0RSZ3_BLOTA|nr:hypothetical protein RDWZM_003884 [Blomia tropicalis]
MNNLSMFKEYLGFNKSHIYNLEQRKKPAELVRKDLISAMKIPEYENVNREHFIKILDSWKEEWEKGVQVPVNPDSLPRANVVQFDLPKVLQEAKHLEQFCILSKLDHQQPKPQTSSFSPSTERKHLSEKGKSTKKLLDTNESTNQTNSKYELDLQDICWLDAVILSDLKIHISDSLLEDVINELEQQCAKNIKEQQIGIEYDENTRCDVCQSVDAEEHNEMVFCELCNICVHQTCYGILDIPYGDWICNSCRESGSKKSVVCVLCPNIGGALKPTTKANKWAHVCCALWLPEVKFVSIAHMEPIDINGILKLKNRDTICSLCNVKKGYTICCDEPNCKVNYHVTCAFNHHFKMDYQVDDNRSTVLLKSYCKKHSNSFNHDMVQTSSEETTKSNNNNLNPLHEFWKYVEISKVYHEISKKYLDSSFSEMKTIANGCQTSEILLHQLIDLIYNYWKLKRVSNYGNSLIKLSFEEKFQEEMQFHMSKLIDFRYHLERLRTLSYMICRREKMKEQTILTQKEIFEKTCQLISNNKSYNTRLIQQMKFEKLNHREPTNMEKSEIKLEDSKQDVQSTKNKLKTNSETANSIEVTPKKRKLSNTNTLDLTSSELKKQQLDSKSLPISTIELKCIKTDDTKYNQKENGLIHHRVVDHHHHHHHHHHHSLNFESETIPRKLFGLTSSANKSPTKNHRNNQHHNHEEELKIIKLSPSKKMGKTKHMIQRRLRYNQSNNCRIK